LTLAAMMLSLSGLLNIYKPSGVSSFWVVKQVKRILGVKKVGHCGTLDPLAEGVLLIVYGAATKQQEKYMGGDKTYRTRLRLGVATDTGDTTGRVLAEKPVPEITSVDLREILKTFQGEIQQIPPMYSALKQNGVRLYALARKGMTVERQPRTVTIHRIEPLHLGAGTVELRVDCSKGTYIRTLVGDIGNAIGCGATVEYLCRERSSGFSCENALDGKLLYTCDREQLLAHAQPVVQP
jgi:tRNA pseudouridine55 synthase